MSSPSDADREKSLALKARGNQHFSAGKHADAIVAFTEAIKLWSTNETFYSNRCASYTALNKLELALQDAETVISLKPEWSKGYSRIGAVYFLQKKFEESVKAYTNALKYEAESKEIKDNLAKAQEQLNKYNAIAAQVAEARAKQEAEDKLKTPEERKAQEDAKKIETTVIGIDLGTTYSCVGVWKEDKVEIIPNDQGDRTTPSWVAFRPDTGERLVGVAALNQAASNTENTLYDVKRILGQKYSEEGVENDIRRFPFVVKPNADNRPVIEVKVQDKITEYLPEQISALVLGKMKQTAESYLGHPVKKAVITVPAYFNDSQRQATKIAGALAGLEVLRIINEPTAAALSYGLDQKKDGLNVLIFDLGGGTFDVSILHLAGGIFEVLATAGDTHLGGEDFDHAVLEMLQKEAKKLNLPDFSGNARATRRLKTAIERAKRQLSDAVQAEVQVESLIDGQDFKYTLSRAKFEQVNKRHFQKCLDTVEKVLKDAKLKTTDIDDVVLVGGSTRIPYVQQTLIEYFGGKELCKTLNPDEAVAYGAAVQGAILSGVRHQSHQMMLLMDVTPLSLGIETVGKVMSTIIKRNTQIPCRKSHIFTTEENYQSGVDIAVYEGERKTTEGNNLLGEFNINGIERAKRGEPQIEVTFDLDANGILTVTAKDLKTSATANIEIKNRGQLSQVEVAALMQKAQDMAADDEARIARVEARNELDRVLLQVREIADNTKDKKLGPILTKAVAAAEEWAAANAETATAEELKKKIKEMEKRCAHVADN